MRTGLANTAPSLIRWSLLSVQISRQRSGSPIVCSAIDHKLGPTVGSDPTTNTGCCLAACAAADGRVSVVVAGTRPSPFPTGVVTSLDCGTTGLRVSTVALVTAGAASGPAAVGAAHARAVFAAIGAAIASPMTTVTSARLNPCPAEICRGSLDGRCEWGDRG